MHAVTIREATAADIPTLAALTKHAGLIYDWAARLGGGGTAYEHLALVAADVEGSACGVIGVGPPPIGTIDAVWERQKGTFDPSRVPWWKVNVLAVDRSHRREGIARSLLHETVQRLPRAHVGLYGSLEQTREDSITWLRRQGFYIGPASGLTPTERPRGRDAIGLVPTPGEVYFRGYRSILRDHLENRAHPKWEERAARAEYARQVALYANSGNALPDVGYRFYAQRIANGANENFCLHASMGPRPMFVFGWDPGHRRVCAQCVDEYLARIEKYDVEELCDGCGNEHVDTRMSFATDDDRMLLIAAGLCPKCRSGPADRH